MLPSTCLLAHMALCLAVIHGGSVRADRPLRARGDPLKLSVMSRLR